MQKIIFLALLGLALVCRPALAGPITVCSGSWDGPGLTACELLGGPGKIGLPLSFSNYFYFDPLPRISITARPGGTLEKTPSGSLRYANGFDVFDSFLDPLQFAYWEDEKTKAITVGVEDLSGPSDWDHNDFIQVYYPADDVPEPAGLALLGMGLLFFSRRVFR